MFAKILVRNLRTVLRMRQAGHIFAAVSYTDKAIPCGASFKNLLPRKAA